MARGSVTLRRDDVDQPVERGEGWWQDKEQFPSRVLLFDGLDDVGQGFEGFDCRCYRLAVPILECSGNWWSQVEPSPTGR